jgi:hypothetical protein
MNGQSQQVNECLMDGAAPPDVVDSAISHCEKLRRILELEEWIAAARGNALLAGSCRAWHAEHQRPALRCYACY